MPLLSVACRREAEQVVALAFTNPFSPQRVVQEQRVLGDRFAGQRSVWSHQADGDDNPNFHALMEVARELARDMQQALRRGTLAEEGERRLYEDLVCFVLYYEFREDLKELMARTGASRQRFLASFWKRYRAEHAQFFDIEGCRFSSQLSLTHLFALGFQLRRAFEHTFYSIIGHSLTTAGVRAAVWQSVFTHDLRRYYRGFYRKMDNYVTLIIGPSGTGKELVARAIGMSRYIPFDEANLQFREDYESSFCPVNLSALSPTLIESELFGHSKGSFTGATADRAGWLEVCGEHGCVFLDEIGDLDARIQVKLLRVFEDRVFQRLGETGNRRFRGKVVAATNRNLADEIQQAGFRQDFYYRICSDLIRVPTLSERIGEEPGELRGLVRYLVGREIEDRVEQTAGEVLRWIEDHLGVNYAWPGNIRELEQCVRNVLIRQHYEPLQFERPAGADQDEALRRATGEITLTVEELLTRYCKMAFQKYGSYEAAAERLGVDRRTLRRRIP